jgi:hypothetical protein
MSKSKIFTPAVLAEVARLVAQGRTKQDIAEQLGCKQSSLTTVCSVNRISLRRPNGSRKPRKPPKVEIALQVPLPISPQAMLRLRHHATAKGINIVKLATDLLELIATDDLYDAILDDHQLEPEAA